MPTVLEDSLLADTLESLPGWQGGTGQIAREISATSEQLDEVVSQVERDAAAMGHQLTVERRQDVLRFVLSSPELGGVTEVDIALASHISDLIHRLTGLPGVDAVRKGESVVVRRGSAAGDSGADEQATRSARPLPTSNGFGAAPLLDDDVHVPDPELPLLEDRP